MLCLVNSRCARVFSLLNSVKYDCSLILSVHLGRSTVFKFLRIIYSMQLQFAFFELFIYAVTVPKNVQII